ncbi:hypothetical protein MLD38_023104 [Melastoma candidum]|uniref:Uncharacterized protein n=1 Tax=Melastoma candidum TaxID=119954 RepID=A0ACB9QMM9_9MYRT|nr:hypothetical protein MLD38_023104 [Melastoma candidum]
MGAIVPLLWTLILLSVNMVQARSRPDTINIGAVMSYGTVVGGVARIAMEAAATDINADPDFLGGSRFALTFHDSNFSGFLGIVGALQFMEADTVAIIGPQNSGVAHVLSHLANELHVPMLSFTALDPNLTPVQYPYFIQTAPSDLYQMSAVADIISYFGWGDVVAVFSDDDHNRNGVSVLGDQLARKRCKISYKAPLPPDPKATRSDVEAALATIQLIESRVIVLHSNMASGLMVFDVAESLGMMESGYVWIATSWLSSLLDSNPSFSSTTAKHLQGVLTLRLHTADSGNKAAFESRWNHLSNNTIGLNPYGLYAYDTVWTVARAVKKFLEQGNNISFSDDTKLNGLGRGTLNLKALTIFNGGQELLDNILHTNFTGLTGPVQFNPDRSLIHPAYDVITVLEDGYKTIGFWSNYSGLSVVPPETLYSKPPNRSVVTQRLNSVIWPGGNTSTPRGWVFRNNGMQLRIGVPRRVSFQEFVKEVNGTDVVRGYCIDVFLAAIKRLPYALPYRFIMVGDGHHNPSYDDLVNLVAEEVIDAAVGDIVIVANRTKVVDFTQPYIESGLVVVTSVRELSSSPWTFSRPFTPVMWAVTALSFLVVGMVVWILEHRINEEFRGPPRKQIVNVLWFSFSTMFFAQRVHPMSSLGRMVIIIWLFIVLIITSSYTASLTSILTVQQLSSPIQGIQSLITSEAQIGFQVGSYAKNYMIDELNIASSRLVALGSPEEYAEALESGRVAAVVDEQSYIDLFLRNNCRFSVRGEQFTKAGWGFAFQRDSPLAIDMSTTLLTLSENGELQKIHNEWLSKKSCSSQASSTGSEKLQLKSFWGLFLVCGISCILAILAYLLSALRKFCQEFTETSDSSSAGSSRTRQLQTFLTYMDSRKDRSRSGSQRQRADETSIH